MTIEPAADASQAPVILRAHLWPDPSGGADPALLAEELVLVEGTLSRSQLRQLADGDLSQALERRIVPAVRWLEADGHVVLAPATRLVPATTYTVASGPAGFAQELTTRTDDPSPILERLWPPIDVDAAVSAVVWCGDEPLPEVAFGDRLAPGGAEGHFGLGPSFGSNAMGSGVVDRCIWFESTSGLITRGPAWSAPPLIGGQDGSDAFGWMAPPAVPFAAFDAVAYLDPSPIQVGVPGTTAGAVSCDPGERLFGPGCARVEDDRILVRTPDEPLLWVMTMLGRRWTVATAEQSTFLIHPVPAATRFALDLQILDTRGLRQASLTEVATLPPMPHVVLNEVLANPNGPEPEQEWLELYNDGLAPASLGGTELVDAGGVTVLPDAILLPGQYALVVNEAFDEQSEFDQPPAVGTLLVRVPTLGHNGLSNDGEPLSLRDSEGVVWSRFPAAPRPKAGQSVMRVTPRAPDTSLGSFRRSESGPTPGAANDADL